MQSPSVSVIMSVYNGQEHLREAVESILSQTFTDFEFIIINDGSTDRTQEILEEYARRDKRIVILEQENIGLTKSLNRGIHKARGEYIARQDGDDKSFPARLEKEYGAFCSNKNLVLVGTWFRENYNDKYFSEVKLSLTSEELRRRCFLQNCFAHTSAMFKRKINNELALYDESFECSQDFELWMRLAARGEFEIVKETLVERRIHKSAITRKRRLHQCYSAFRARLRHADDEYASRKIKALTASLYQLIMAFVPNRIILAKRRTWK